MRFIRSELVNVLVAGCYQDSIGNDRVVLVDSHFFSAPNTATADAVIDVPMNTFYSVATTLAATLIRHTN